MPPRPGKKTPTSAQKKAGAKTPSKSPKTAVKAVKPVEAEIVEEEAQVTPSTAVDAPKVEESKPSETTIPTESSSQAEKNDSAVGKRLVEDVTDEKVVKAEEKEAEVVKGNEGLGVEQTDVAMKEVHGDGGDNRDADGEEAGNDVVVDQVDEEEAQGGEYYEEEITGDEGHAQDMEMPAPVKERRKQKEFEVFVGGLDKDATEEDLKKVFGEVGEVVEIRLARNPQTNKNKGFAFIRYGTIEQAKKAVAELKNPQVRGKRCGVTRSQDNETLYVRNISRTWTKEALREKLKDYGLDNVEEITLMDDPQQEGKNRGFTFLEFNTHLEATNAFKRLQKRDVFFGVDICAKVAFAKSGIEPDEEVMAQVKSVFVDGLPATWDEDQVKDKFKKYGDIENVQLARNMPTAKRRDFGFINFIVREAALACIEGVNKNELVDGDKKVTMKATLRKPQQKGRSVKEGNRGGYHIGYGASRGGRVPWSRGASSHYGSRFEGRGGRGFVGEREYYNAREFPSRGRNMASSRMYDRRPSGPDHVPSSYRRNYREEDEFYIQSRARASSRSAGAVARRPLYGDQYGYDEGYSESMGASRSSIPSRRPAYGEDGYGYHMDEVSVYHDAPVRNYDILSGSKRPFSDMDPELAYAGPPARRLRSHLDHEMGAGALGGSRAGGIDGGSYGHLYSSRDVSGYGPRGGSGSYY